MSIKSLWNAQVANYNAQPFRVRLAYTAACYGVGFVIGRVINKALDNRLERQLSALLAEDNKEEAMPVNVNVSQAHESLQDVWAAGRASIFANRPQDKAMVWEAATKAGFSEEVIQAYWYDGEAEGEACWEPEGSMCPDWDQDRDMRKDTDMSVEDQFRAENGYGSY
jgi:hypothetical protein